MFFSIIMPVYNADIFLEQSIGSVLDQRFTDWELILVDDGSNDSSGKICELYAKACPKIKVFHVENGGASVARNVGLDNALGDYILFVDADDQIKPNYLADIWDAIDRFPASCYLGSRRTDFDDTGSEHDVVLYDAAAANNLELNGLLSYFFGPADDAPFATWHNVYSRQFLTENCLHFDAKMVWSEDRDFLLRAFSTRPTFYCLNVSGYCYRVDNASSVTAKADAHKILLAMAGDEKWARISSENSLFATAARFFAADYINLTLMSFDLPEEERDQVLGRASENPSCFAPAVGGSFFCMLVQLHARAGCLRLVGKVALKLTLICRKLNRLAVCAHG